MKKTRDISKLDNAELYCLMSGDSSRSVAAFDELYSRLSHRVFRYCMRVFGDRDTAEDVFQETFVRLYKGAANRSIDRDVTSYVLKIARNACLDVKSSKHYGLAPIEDYDAPIAAETHESKELLDLIRDAVAHLPEEFREVFVLRQYEGLTYAEISDLTGVSMATVKVRLYRAKNRLRKILSPYISDLAL